MANRRNSSNKNDSSTDNKPTTEVQEDTVSTTTTEAPASSESTEAEAPIDLTAFLAAVSTAVSEDNEARDKTTGELPEAVIDPVNVEFRKLDGAKPKNAARKELGKLMKDAMNELQMPLARSYMILSESLSAGSSGSKSERTPTDPTEAFVARLVGLRLATDLASASVPEGVSEDWKDKANTLYTESKSAAEALLAYQSADAETRGDEPEASAVVKAAVKLAQGKSAKVGGGSGASRAAGDGVRRDIAKHIAEAFADKASGEFLTIAQIRSFKSSEYDGVEPSAGAISARLFPNSGKESTVEGVTPAEVDGKKGATKN